MSHKLIISIIILITLFPIIVFAQENITYVAGQMIVKVTEPFEKKYSPYKKIGFSRKPEKPMSLEEAYVGGSITSLSHNK